MTNEGPTPSDEEEELAGGERRLEEDAMRQAGHEDPERAREREDDE